MHTHQQESTSWSDNVLFYLNFSLEVPEINFDGVTDISSSSSDLANFDATFPASDSLDFETPQEPSSSENSTSPQLRWVDESKEFFSESRPEPQLSVSSDDIDKVRKRITKRKCRPLEMKLDQAPKSDKRMRNTMAARRYRERQRRDVEVLDSRVKQLEEELNKSKLEVMWWKMESKRWEEKAERMSREL